jgi:hypothetical protein
MNISACFPIKIPAKDKFFTEPGDTKCFEFPRSKPTDGGKLAKIILMHQKSKILFLPNKIFHFLII